MAPIYASILVLIIAENPTYRLQEAGDYNARLSLNRLCGDRRQDVNLKQSGVAHRRDKLRRLQNELGVEYISRK